MNKGKKFDLQVAQNDGSWTAKIIRRVNRKQTVVSKKQTGFTTQAEAQAWGETALKSFLENLAERNRRRAAGRLP